jgi:hypothetical protein
VEVGSTYLGKNGLEEAVAEDLVVAALVARGAHLEQVLSRHAQQLLRLSCTRTAQTGEHSAPRMRTMVKQRRTWSLKAVTQVLPLSSMMDMFTM